MGKSSSGSKKTARRKLKRRRKKKNDEQAIDYKAKIYKIHFPPEEADEAFLEKLEELRIEVTKRGISRKFEAIQK